MTEELVVIEQQIFEYIRKNTLADIKKISAQSLLFKEGVFDSMGFVLLIEFLEDKFNIKTNDDDLIEENFESVTAITNYIQRKMTS